jgi:hypothetical protein
MPTFNRTLHPTLEPPSGATQPVPTRARNLPSLHDDPQKIYRLLDLLGLPPGTEVKVTTVAASAIVR